MYTLSCFRLNVKYVCFYFSEKGRRLYAHIARNYSHTVSRTRGFSRSRTRIERIRSFISCDSVRVKRRRRAGVGVITCSQTETFALPLLPSGVASGISLGISPTRQT